MEIRRKNLYLFFVIIFLLSTLVTVSAVQNPYSAIVYQNGTNYISEDYTGQQIVSTTNKTEAIRQAIENVGGGGDTWHGIVFLRGISMPFPSTTLQNSLEINSYVTVIGSRSGITSMYGDFGHTGGNNDVEKPAFRLYCIDNKTKPIIEWRDNNNNAIAWIVAHYKKNANTTHQHISIETADEALAGLYSRFEVTYGLASNWVYVNNAKFGVPTSGIHFKDPSGDYNTKIWQSAEDEIRLSTKAKTRLKIDNCYVTVYRRVVPSSDNVYSLGMENKRFKHGYFSNMVSIRHDSADYGGDFLTYIPPNSELREGAILTVEDTNITNPAHRIFVYSGSAWRYVNLTDF